jgi:hypothetical protein
MNISEKANQTAKSLSAHHASFLQFVVRNSEGLERSHFKQVTEQTAFLSHNFQPWPIFIDASTREELEHASVKVFQLMAEIPQRIFKDNSKTMSQYYGIPETDMDLMLFGVDIDYLKNCLGRGDYIMTSDSQLKCIEYNIVGNLGGWEIDFMMPQYTHVPVISKFLSNHGVRVKESRFFATLFSHFAREGIKRLKHSLAGKKELNVAIAFPKLSDTNTNHSIDIQLQMIYRGELAKLDPRFSGNLISCELGKLEPDQEGLMMDGKRIHVLLEMNNGGVSLPVMDLVNMDKLVVFNGPVTWLMSNKLNMALLSEHQDSDIFNKEEQDIIKKYIPWTRKTVPGQTDYHGESIQLEEFALQHREKLVLKPATGLGGEGVCIGRQSTADEWKNAVSEAINDKNWIIQDYYESATYMFQQGESGCNEHNAVWGLFVFGKSGYAGGFVRLLESINQSGVINVKQGAEKTILIEVE